MESFDEPIGLSPLRAGDLDVERTIVRRVEAQRRRRGKLQKLAQIVERSMDLGPRLQRRALGFAGHHHLDN